MAYDFTNQKITLTPDVKLGIKHRVESIASSHNDLTQETQNALNELSSAVDSITSQSGTDVTEIQNKLNILADIFSKDGEANDVFDAIVGIVDSWNNGGEIVKTIETPFNSATGIATVDLTAFGFTDTSYKVIGSVDTLGSLKASVGFDKTDANTITIKAYDKACFVEDAVMYDASTNSFNVTVGVAYERQPLSFTLTDETGAETTI